MSFHATAPDVPVIITVAGIGNGPSGGPSLATERRVTPSWTVLQLKAKLETSTGIPPGSQRLLFKSPGRENRWIEGDQSIVADLGLARGCEIEIHDTRPATARPNFSDLSSVEKYNLPSETYESLPNTVLSWKKNQGLGRFDPNALSPKDQVRQQVEKDQTAIEKNNISVPARAIVLPSTPPHVRRGTIRYVGSVPTIPYSTHPPLERQEDSDLPEPLWVGIELDEPMGKNDGSHGGKRYFSCPDKRGVLVKPEKVQVGDFPPLGLDDLEDEDMEEI